MNRYQDMGLDQPNMVALDVVDALIELDESRTLTDADISDVMEAYALLIEEHGSLPVREFLPMLHQFTIDLGRQERGSGVPRNRQAAVALILFRMLRIHRRYQNLL